MARDYCKRDLKLGAGNFKSEEKSFDCEPARPARTGRTAKPGRLSTQDDTQYRADDDREVVRVYGKIIRILRQGGRGRDR
jgi:hypothetical protein